MSAKLIFPLGEKLKVPVITQKGRSMNAHESAARFPYQDPALPVAQRVEDLLGRMSLEDKAGMMFYAHAMVGDIDTSHYGGRMPSLRTLFAHGLNHFNIFLVPGTREFAEWHNLVQGDARHRGLGIPVTIAADPQQHDVTYGLVAPFSKWPEPLGLAAIGSAELVGQFAEVIRREYLAVGIRVALHPQLDLATEPRWARQSHCFGADAEVASRLGVAYIRGLHGGEFGAESVCAGAKHFPGAGPHKNGEDSHFSYGREQVYPGHRFDHHLKPFEAAIEAGVRRLQPYYSMPVGTEYEEVGFGFNKSVITGLLRERLGFDGIVCAEWFSLSQMVWGVEHLTYEERMIKALDAGVDQFGGEYRSDVLVSLVKAGAVTEARLDTSVRRLLREKFELGLFDNPFVDADLAETIVGTDTARAQGLAAQEAAHTLLKNTVGSAHLPLATGLKIYTEGITADALGERGLPVATPEQADIAVLRLKAPYEKRGADASADLAEQSDQAILEQAFHAGSLDFEPQEAERIRAICRTVPTVIVIYLDRPAILTPFNDDVASLIAEFGATEDATVHVLFGEAEPRGHLPFDLPSSMAEVEAGRSDVPFDTANPLYRFGHGLSYPAR
jgi:beta-glucosidase